MKNSNDTPCGQLACKWKSLCSVISRFTALAVLLLLLLGRQASAQSLPYTETFDSGTAAGWTVLDTLGAFIGQPGTVTFPGGNTYSLAHPAIPLQDYISSVGMARMSSWAPTYTTNHFQMSVDLLDLNQTAQLQEFGLNAHARDIGPGTTKAYTFHYLPLAAGGLWDGFILENTFTEVYQGWMSGNFSAPDYTALIGWYDGCNSAQPYHMDPAKAYRMVFLGSDLRFEGRVYELPDLSKPVVICVVHNTGGFTNGLAGIQVQNIYGANALEQVGQYTGPCAATVDNFTVSETYSAYAGTPSVPSLGVHSAGGTNIVTWPGEVLGLWAMEQSTSLDTGAVWTDVPLWQIQYDAASGLRKHVATNSPMGFYRLRKL